MKLAPNEADLWLHRRRIHYARIFRRSIWRRQVSAGRRNRRQQRRPIVKSAINIGRRRTWADRGATHNKTTYL